MQVTQRDSGGIQVAQRESGGILVALRDSGSSEGFRNSEQFR